MQRIGLRTAIVIAAMALLVSSCSSGGSGSEISESSGANLAPHQSGYDKTATFTYAVSVAPSSLNIHKASFSGNYTQVNTMLYDRLTYVNPYNGELKPMLATSWDASSDSTSITFKLRDDVTYHDSVKMTAQTIVQNFDYGKAMGKSSPISTQYDLIDSAEAVDEFAVTYHLGGPYAGAVPQMMAGPLGMSLSPDALDRTDDTTYEAGTGPYKLVSAKAGQQYEYEPYQGYWDPTAQNMAKLVILIQPDEETILNGVLSGQIDAAAAAVSNLTRAENDPNVKVLTKEGAGSAYVMWMNLDLIPGGHDPKVRQAINMAVDRDEINAGALDGACAPAVQPYNDSRPDWTNPDLKGDYYKYDPNKAKKLLAEAGFPDGIKFDLDTLNVPRYLPVLEIMQSQMAKAGITVNIKPMSTTELVTGWRVDQTLDTYFTRTPVNQPPFIFISDWYLPDSPNNPGHWENKTLTNLYAKWAAEADPEKSNELLSQMAVPLVKDPAHGLILCHEDRVVLTGPDVIGFGPDVFGYIDFRSAGIRKK